MLDRFAVHFQHPLLNYDERDGDPYDHIEQAIAHARAKAETMVITSVNKIKILDMSRDDANKKFRITFCYAQTMKPTGAFIEVRPVPKFQHNKASGIRETYAGGILGD